jgi:hypothetical protein
MLGPFLVGNPGITTVRICRTGTVARTVQNCYCLLERVMSTQKQLKNTSKLARVETILES